MARTGKARRSRRSVRWKSSGRAFHVNRARTNTARLPCVVTAYGTRRMRAPTAESFSSMRS